MSSSNSFPNPAISVLTAAKNAAEGLLRLHASLDAQTFRRFEWIVVDGASKDGTVGCLERLSQRSPWLHYSSEGDFGVYDALNKAIGVASAGYYLVVGADDTLAPDALENFASKADQSDADVIFARVMRGGGIVGGFWPRRSWIGTARVFATSHSCGMLIRTDLHARFGLYLSRFPLLADVFFLKTLLRSNTVRFATAEFVAGKFGDGGLSSTNKLQILAENWQIQMLTEPSPVLQTLLFFGKVIARFPAVTRELHASKQLRTRNAVSVQTRATKATKGSD